MIEKNEKIERGGVRVDRHRPLKQAVIIIRVKSQQYNKISLDKNNIR